MDKGQIALIIAQTVVLIVGSIIYSLQHGLYSGEKRDRGNFGETVRNAVDIAKRAASSVDMLDTEKYERLARKYVQLLEEHEALKVRVAAMEESIKSLSNKLASRQRSDTLAARRESAAPAPAPADAGDIQIPPGVDPIAWLAQHGFAQPLGNQVAHQQQELPINAIPANFGEVRR